MKRTKISLLTLLLCTLVSSAAFAQVDLKGSDVAQYFPRQAMKTYEKSGDVTWHSGFNKNSAITSLAEADSCDIAFSTWQLSELDNQDVLDALDIAEGQGIEFSQTPVVIDAIPPIVHKDNPVSSISLEQLHKIYTGEITTWHEIDSAVSGDILIEVYTTGESDGKYIIWKDIVLRGGKDIGIPAPKDISPAIASDDHKWAIGFDSMYYIKMSDTFANDEIKILNITNREGLSAGPSKEFPVSRYLYMITRSDISEEAQDFIAYLLDNETQQLAYEVHQLPLKVSGGSSSSNCNAGFTGLAFLAVVPLILATRKKVK